MNQRQAGLDKNNEALEMAQYSLSLLSSGAALLDSSCFSFCWDIQSLPSTPIMNSNTTTQTTTANEILPDYSSHKMYCVSTKDYVSPRSFVLFFGSVYQTLAVVPRAARKKFLKEFVKVCCRAQEPKLSSC